MGCDGLTLVFVDLDSSEEYWPGVLWKLPQFGLLRCFLVGDQVVGFGEPHRGAVPSWGQVRGACRLYDPDLPNYGFPTSGMFFTVLHLTLVTFEF